MSQQYSGPASPTRLLPFAEIEKRVGRSRWWIRAKINEGAFPKPVPIAGRRVAFVETEVESWISDQIAKREVI